MRETKFIAQNKDKWQEYEHLLKLYGDEGSAEKLSDLYVQITDDLSYSRTFYANRSVRVYLNGLAQKLFMGLYGRGDGLNGKRLWRFWAEDLPRTVWATRWEFLLSFGVLVFSVGLAVLSCQIEPDTLGVILGGNYVEMTKANIAKGDPMAVYKQVNEIDMTLGITLNNLYVDFLIFISGLFFGVGSIAMHIRHGVMLGAFHHLFYEHGLLWESFLTVWIHGTIEIATMIISCAAGIVLGKGLLFPGTYSRIQSFMLSARRAVQILLGVLPLTVLAGIFEGTLTRHTSVPDVVRLGIIVCSMLLIVWYYVVLPYKVSRIVYEDERVDVKLPPDTVEATDFTVIHDSGGILMLVFEHLNKYFSYIMRYSLGASVVYIGLLKLSGASKVFDVFGDDMVSYEKVAALFVYSKYPLLYVFNSLLLSGVIAVSYFCIVAMYEQKQYRVGWNWSLFRQFVLKNGLRIVLPVLLLNSVFFVVGIPRWFEGDGVNMASLIPSFFALSFLLSIGFVFFAGFGLWILCMVVSGDTLLGGFMRSVHLYLGSTFRVVGTMSIAAFVSSFLYSLISSPIFMMHLNFVNWYLALEGEILQSVLSFTLMLFSLFSAIVMFHISVLAIGYQYFTLLEITQASALKTRIHQIGTRNRAYGMERE
jgi:uncharacterized membrane protein SpoIIM required for sporulation